MELPASWGLRTEQREDGKLNIIGKTDAGEDYRVRTTDGSEVTANDLAELKAADRESYKDTTSGARAFCDSLVAFGEKNEAVRQQAFHDDLNAASDELVRECSGKGRATRPGMIDMPSSFGSTQKLRENWPF